MMTTEPYACLEHQATLDILDRLDTFIQHIRVSMTLSDETAFNLQLVLTELMTNTIRHSQPPAHSLLKIEISNELTHIQVMLTDHGTPVPPTVIDALQHDDEIAQPDINNPDSWLESGMGLYLFKTLVTHFSYHTEADHNCWQFTMKH